MKRKLCIAVFLLLCTCQARAQVQPIRDLQPTVILISLDGFRADYLDKYKPPLLNRLARRGARARWLIPSFPTKTFPNHYTVATGLYPARHGIVENNIYDRNFNAVFGLSKREEVQNGRWYLGEPIWVTAEKQGQKAGAFFFPGTEAAIGGVRPTYWKEYDGKIPNAERVDTILSWLDKPRAERPTFYTLYFSDVDDAGHDYGPDAPETRAAVLKADADLSRLTEGLRERGVLSRVNLIIVSDHGMAKVNRRNAVFLDDAFDEKLAERVLSTGEITQIFPKDGQEQTIYNSLRAKLPPQAKAYRKAEIPARWHYRDGERVAPIIVTPQEGWVLTTRKRFNEQQAKGELDGARGAHGYDNALPSMRALFIAHGAAIRRGRVVRPFANIHVYNIMARILNLRPAPNDGNFSASKAVLR
jgi:predicted AlkP superfamily pyrophosphatase or phosphodiesterase